MAMVAWRIRVLALILAALVLSAAYPSLACGESYSIFWYSWAICPVHQCRSHGGRRFREGAWTQLITAFVGCLVGLAVGFVVAIYGLGVWS